MKNGLEFAGGSFIGFFKLKVSISFSGGFLNEKAFS
jgi:hypothetical protein